MKRLVGIINNASAIIVFVLASFSQEILSYFKIQRSEIDSAYLVIYPFISSLFLLQWLRLKQKGSKLSEIIDNGELLATGITIFLPFLITGFVYLMFQSENRSITKIVNFIGSFIIIGFLIPAAISQTAYVVETLSYKRIGMYFAITVFLALAISIDKIREIPFFVKELRFLVFILLYGVVHFPNYRRVKSDQG